MKGAKMYPTVKTIQWIAAALLAVVVHNITLANCADNTTSTRWFWSKPTTVVDVLCNPTFSTLKEAVVAAGLLPILTDPNGSITLFAPTNAAFDAALVTLGITKAQLLASPDLVNILKYHVSPGARTLKQLPNGNLPTLLVDLGVIRTVKISRIGSYWKPSVFVNNVNKVICPNLRASNGIAQGINGVLIPPLLTGGAQEVQEVQEAPVDDREVNDRNNKSAPEHNQTSSKSSSRRGLLAMPRISNSTTSLSKRVSAESSNQPRQNDERKWFFSFFYPHSSKCGCY